MANEKTYPNYLMHYRTKGSKNGVSTTKGYTAVGHKANGHWINGRYVYDIIPRPKYQSPMDYARSEGYARYEAHKAANNKKLTFDTPKSYGGNIENTQSGSVSKPSSLHISPRGHYVNGHYVYYEDEAKQRAFRQGLAEYRGRNSAYENQAMVKRMENARKADVLDQNIYGKKIKGYARLADISPYEKQRLANKYLSNSPQHRAAVNQHNAEVAGKNAALAYAQKKRKWTNIGASQAADAARMNAETHNRFLSSSKGSLEKGASNNWQQKANVSASGKPSGYSQSHYNAVNQRNAEQAGRNQALENARKASARNAKAKAIANGTQNGWQQKANKTAGILGGMTREDRSAAQKIEPYKVNDSFNVAEYSQNGVNRRRSFNNDMEYGNSFERNHRSDIGNAIADAKVDAKKAFNEAKSDAKQAFVNLKSKVKKKKKSFKDFFK